MSFINFLFYFFTFGSFLLIGQYLKIVPIFPVLYYVPKKWRSHYYILAMILSWSMTMLAVGIYFNDVKLNSAHIGYLDLICGQNREVKTTSLRTLTALVLMSLHCTKRAIETNFLQIFSSIKKDVIHYLLGFVFYIGIFAFIVGEADGFVKNHPAKITFNPIEIFFCLFVSLIFIFLSFKQFESNLILINLRKSKDGKIATEAHLMPDSGWFKFVSCPHMTTEVGIYFALYALIYGNTSIFYCVSCVFMNQIAFALEAHKNYKENFKNYPKERKAIFPYLL